MKKNNILIDLERMRYPYSGLSNVCDALIKGIKELQKIDNTITYYGNNNTLQKIQVDKREYWKPWHKIHNPILSKYNLIHITHQASTYFPNCNSDKILTLHDLNFLHEEKSKRKIKKEIEVFNNNLKNTKYLVCISEFTKQDFLNNKHLFTYDSNMKIVVIHNGIVFKKYKKNLTLDNYKFLKNKDYILNIGVLHPKKNQISLLHLLTNNQSLYLVLVFSSKKTEYETLFIKKAKELGVFNRILCLENITEDQKSFLLENCKALVHPSIAEGFGIPPIEAMYFGKPVFVSRLTSLPEIVGQEGFYWNSFDAEHMNIVFNEGIAYYNSIPQKKELLINWAMKYSHTEMAKKYLSLYSKITVKHA